MMSNAAKFLLLLAPQYAQAFVFRGTGWGTPHIEAHIDLAKDHGLSVIVVQEEFFSERRDIEYRRGAIAAQQFEQFIHEIADEIVSLDIEESFPKLMLPGQVLQQLSREDGNWVVYVLRSELDRSAGLQPYKQSDAWASAARYFRVIDENDGLDDGPDGGLDGGSGHGGSSGPHNLNPGGSPSCETRPDLSSDSSSQTPSPTSRPTEVIQKAPQSRSRNGLLVWLLAMALRSPGGTTLQHALTLALGLSALIEAAFASAGSVVEHFVAAAVPASTASPATAALALSLEPILTSLAIETPPPATSGTAAQVAESVANTFVPNLSAGDEDRISRASTPTSLEQGFQQGFQKNDSPLAISEHLDRHLNTIVSNIVSQVMNRNLQNASLEPISLGIEATIPGWAIAVFPQNALSWLYAPQTRRNSMISQINIEIIGQDRPVPPQNPNPVPTPIPGPLPIPILFPSLFPAPVLAPILGLIRKNHRLMPPGDRNRSRCNRAVAQL